MRADEIFFLEMMMGLALFLMTFYLGFSVIKRGKVELHEYVWMWVFCLCWTLVFFLKR